MSAVVRVWWLFFAAFPIQRWFAIAGVVLLALGVAVGALSGEMRFWFPIAFTALFVLACVPAAFAAGAVLRALSAPRSHQLFPHFRVRALLALVLFVATMLAIVVVPAVSVLAMTSRDAPIELVVLYPIGILTAIVLTMFVVSGQWNWVWVEIPLGIAFMHWLGGGGADRLRDAGLPLQWLAGAAALLAWIVFATWYLRVRRVPTAHDCPTHESAVGMARRR